MGKELTPQEELEELREAHELKEKESATKDKFSKFFQEFLDRELDRMPYETTLNSSASCPEFIDIPPPHFPHLPFFKFRSLHETTNHQAEQEHNPEQPKRPRWKGMGLGE